MRKRRGFTLVEMVAVAGTTTVLFGVATGILIMLMQVDRSWREQVRVHATVARLADQFRRDVHAAERLAALRAEAGKPDAGWQFQLVQGRVVEYRASPGRLLRVQLDRGKISQQEDYLLPAKATFSVQPDGAAAGLVTLTMTPQPEPSELTARGPLQIVASLGRDHRLARRQGH